MFRTRRLGVEEGNAIETIMAYEMKLERGTATAEDKLAHDAACRVLGTRSAVTAPRRPTPQMEAERKGSGTPPPVSYMINPISLEGYWAALKVVGAMFLLFALSCMLAFLLVAAVQGFVSLAHP